LTQTKDEQIAQLKRRADALEQALRRIDALYTDAQGQGNPYVSWMGAIARVALTDQPAQDGKPSTDQERFERVWQQLVYSVADFFALEITDAQAQSIAREVLQVADAGEPEHRATLSVVPDAYGGWNVTEDSRIVSGPHRSQADAVEAMRARARRTKDTGGRDE
jgi:hypothetical protein